MKKAILILAVLAAIGGTASAQTSNIADVNVANVFTARQTLWNPLIFRCVDTTAATLSTTDRMVLTCDSTSDELKVSLNGGAFTSFLSQSANDTRYVSKVSTDPQAMLATLQLPLGAVGTPSLRGPNATTGIYFSTNTMHLGANGVERMRVGVDGSPSAPVTVRLGLALGATPAAPDVFLLRDAANVGAQKNGTNAQASRIYDTESGSDSEFAQFGFQTIANTFRIFTHQTGAGVAQPVQIGVGTSGGLTINTSNNASFSGSVAIGGGTAITKYLSGTASLDYGTALATTCETLTVGVTGAVDGNVVDIGVPNALANHNTTSTFTAWVSAADTVSVRRCVLAGDGSNPAAGTVRASVWQH